MIWSHFVAVNDFTRFKVVKCQLLLLWDQKIHEPRCYKVIHQLFLS